MNVNRLSKRIGAAALLVAAFSAGQVTGQPADAATYGGCKEGWQAPHSAGADQCRAHGWTITSRYVISPHSRLVASRLPHCAYEDETGPCLWDARRDGNGRGSSFIVRNETVRYVWMTGLPQGWHYVRAGSGWDRLPGVSIRTRINVGPTTYLVNPSRRRWAS